MNSYDFDGVLYLGPGRKGFLPREEDVIVTGRSYEEQKVTMQHLRELGISTDKEIYFAPWKWESKTRVLSGIHKARTLAMMISSGMEIQIHFEDDPVQAEIIERALGDKLTVVLIHHDLTEKENVKHET